MLTSITSKVLAGVLVAVLIACAVAYLFMHGTIAADTKTIAGQQTEVGAAAGEIQNQQGQTAIAQQNAATSAATVGAIQQDAAENDAILTAKNQEDTQNASDQSTISSAIDAAPPAATLQPAVSAFFDGLRSRANVHAAPAGGNDGHQAAAGATAP